MINRSKIAVGGLALIPGTVFLTIFIARTARMSDSGLTFTLFDDAMISMAYARTLADTGEWVWYPGADRVQGFTNPLWTLYMSLLHLLGFEGSSAALAITVTSAVLILAAAICVMAIVATTIGDDRRSFLFASVAGGTIPFIYPLTFWSLRGMEVGLLALLLLALIICVLTIVRRADEGHIAWSSILTAAVVILLGVTTRMDFALPATVVVGVMLMFLPRLARLKVAVILVIALGFSLGLVLTFQYAYWGSFLPNTYELKVNGYPLTDRIVRGVLVTAKALPFLVLCTFGFIAMVRVERRGLSRIGLILVSPIVFVTAYSVWVGGDAWEYGGLINRYIAVILPVGVAVGFIGAWLMTHESSRPTRSQMIWGGIVLSLSGLAYGAVSNPPGFNLLLAGSALVLLSALSLAAIAVFAWSQSRQRSLSARGFAALILALLFVATTSGPSYWLWRQDGGLFAEADQDLVESSTALQRVTTPDAVIATAWAGAPAYYTERPSIDLLGKSDAYIASVTPRGFLHPGHNKWDYDYSIKSLQPDVVRELFLPSAGEIEALLSWGYVERCFESSQAFFRIDSKRVIWEELQDCEPFR